MERYNYRIIMQADIKEWLQNNQDEFEDCNTVEDAYNKIEDYLWADDEITGNGGGWYDSEHNCEEYVCHNFYLLFEALFEFGEFNADLIDTLRIQNENNTLARWADCTIRCYLLSECLTL